MMNRSKIEHIAVCDTFKDKLSTCNSLTCKTSICKALLCIALMMVCLSFINPVPCMAADKIDIGAIGGFGKDFSIDDKGKFEISGAMLSNGIVYNITVEGDGIRAWVDKKKGRLWIDKELKDLLNDPTTFFYESVKGDADKAEFSNKVEFARPNGKTW
ncbi:MAG: hypothetical protein K6G03_12670 [Lachnospiraceae bacterium]|nr:hypothetical protein [Lachnospiraceae bacterium]